MANNTSIISVVLTHRHGPVDAQVQRDQDEVVEEKVDSLGPALHSWVSSSRPAAPASQLREEEGAKRVDFQPCCFTGTSLHDQGQVEVNHLGK